MYLYVSQAANQRMADAFGSALDGKFMIFYSGPHPPSADAALQSSNTQLGMCQLGTPAVLPADSSGRIQFNLISPDVSTDAQDHATFMRISNSDGSEVELQGDAGTGNTFVVLNTTAFTLGGSVTVEDAAVQHHNGV